MRKAQKKLAEENLKKAVNAANEKAEAAVSEGKTFCICRLDVGLDAAAVREAVQKVILQKVFVDDCFFLPLQGPIILRIILEPGDSLAASSFMGMVCRIPSLTKL